MQHSAFFVEKQFKKQEAHQIKKSQQLKCPGSYVHAPHSLKKPISMKKYANRIVWLASTQKQEAPENKQSKDILVKHLDVYPGMPMTLKAVYIKRIQQEQKGYRVREHFRKHVRRNIREYLARKYEKPTYLIPLEACQILRVRPPSQKPEQMEPNCVTENLFFYKPYYSQGSLRELAIEARHHNSDKLQTYELPRLIRQLIKCSIEHGGLEDFVMSTSNVYMGDDSQGLHINYTSLLGIAMIKARAPVNVFEYFELAPYLTPRMLYLGRVGMQERVRFFLINCLVLINHRDVFFPEPKGREVSQSEFFSFSDMQLLLFKQDWTKTFDSKSKQKLTEDEIKQLYCEKLKEKYHKNVVQQFKNQIEVKDSKKTINMPELKHFKELLKRGLVECQNITWEEVMNVVCVGNLKVPPPVGKGYDKSSIEYDPDYGNQIEICFRRVHEELFQMQPDKNYYIQRGLNSELIYLPIKHNGELSKMFEKKYWWDIFNVKTKDGKTKQSEEDLVFHHEMFALKLLRAIIDRYESLKVTPENARLLKNDKSIQIILLFLQSENIEYNDQKQESGINQENEEAQLAEPYEILNRIKASINNLC